jgi:hypothetical protein
MDGIDYGQFDRPKDLVVAYYGGIYVSETENFRVQKYSPRP